MPHGDLFLTPMSIVWAYRGAASFLAALWITQTHPAFLLLALACLGMAGWFRARAVLITDVEVLVSRWHRAPIAASLLAVHCVFDDAGHWALRLDDGSEVPLPPVSDRTAVIDALAGRIPGLDVRRFVHHGGALGRFLLRRRRG